MRGSLRPHASGSMPQLPASVRTHSCFAAQLPASKRGMSPSRPIVVFLPGALLWLKMHCLNGRVLKPEILDTLPPEEARGSLADLARINKHWGGHSTLRKLIDDVIPRDEPFTFLDVGSASGDMTRFLRQWRAKKRGGFPG